MQRQTQTIEPHLRPGNSAKYLDLEMLISGVRSKIPTSSSLSWMIRRTDFSTGVGHPVHPGYLVAIAMPQYPGNLDPINGWILMGITEATQNGAWKFPI